MEHYQLLRPVEVARRLSVTRATVYRWYWEGKLQGVKLTDGSLRILESSVLRMMADAW